MGAGDAPGPRPATATATATPLKLTSRIAPCVGRGQNGKPGMVLRVHREVAEKAQMHEEERKKFAPVLLAADKETQRVRPLGKKAAKYARTYQRLQQQRRPSAAAGSVSSLGAEQSVGATLASLMSKARHLAEQKSKKAKKRGSETSDLGFDLPPDYPGFEAGSGAMQRAMLRGPVRGAHVPPRMYLCRREAYALLPGREDPLSSHP